MVERARDAVESLSRAAPAGHRAVPPPSYARLLTGPSLWRMFGALVVSTGAYR